MTEAAKISPITAGRTHETNYQPNEVNLKKDEKVRNIFDTGAYLSHNNNNVSIFNNLSTNC